MKSAHSERPDRKRREMTRTPLDEVLRNCEFTAAQVKAAADELAACWSALTIEISNGASPTDLLRRRAWCNVLELRLRERTALLEKARLNVDAAWRRVIARSRSHHRAHAGAPDSTSETLFAQSWTLLLQPAHPSKHAVVPQPR
ncbi:MAG TPA: hypothetical protein VEH04_11605 [Verrucomicrobiae bacterium]|nr:hypothetical protein [Verrucomicrobiae bacterium]